MYARFSSHAHIECMGPRRGPIPSHACNGTPKGVPLHVSRGSKIPCEPGSPLPLPNHHNTNQSRFTRTRQRFTRTNKPREPPKGGSLGLALNVMDPFGVHTFNVRMRGKPRVYTSCAHVHVITISAFVMGNDKKPARLFRKQKQYQLLPVI